MSWAIPFGICGGQSGIETGFASVTSLSSANKILKKFTTYTLHSTANDAT